MKAVVYQEPHRVPVESVEDPAEQPTDAIVRITKTNIRGSDLRMYEGRTAAEPGMIFGHENQSVIVEAGSVEAGSGVQKVQAGDRVNLPFNIGCGFCVNCEQDRPAFCLTASSDPVTTEPPGGRSFECSPAPRRRGTHSVV